MSEIPENPDKLDEKLIKHLRLPQKRFYRQRAHSNPIADHHFE